MWKNERVLWGKTRALYAVHLAGKSKISEETDFLRKGDPWCLEAGRADSMLRARAIPLSLHSLHRLWQVPLQIWHPVLL